MNITSMLQQARLKDRANHQEKELSKIGNLRVGSSGIMSESGDIAAECARKSYIRSLGLELDPPTVPTQIMWDLGYANEDRVVESLKLVLPEGMTLLREEEIPVSWTTSNGTLVTGRPDIVICKPKAFKLTDVSGVKEPFVLEFPQAPVLGLELKSVHSMWTARDVLFGREPKLNNLAQAAHYMMLLNIPYKLIYRSYSILGQAPAQWADKLFPKEGEPGSEYIQWGDVDKKSGKRTMRGISQFEIVYDLRFDSTGRLEYSVEDEDKWVRTIITREDITRYFEHVSQIASTGNLGPRPTAVTATGEKASFNMCSPKYCPLAETCDNYDKTRDFSKWLKEVRNKLERK